MYPAANFAHNRNPKLASLTTTEASLNNFRLNPNLAARLAPK